MNAQGINLSHRKEFMFGNAVQLKEVGIESNGHAVHVSVQPNAPEPGTILDASGEAMPTVRRPGIMEKLDAKASKRIEISQGTAWLIGAVFILFQIAFSYGSSMLSSARADQTQTEQITALTTALTSQAAASKVAQDEIRSDVKETNRKLEELSKRLHEEAVTRARLEGFKAGEQP